MGGTGGKQGMAPRAKKAAGPPTAVAAAPPMRVHGSLDRVGADGAIHGWCWSPDEPKARRVLALLVDGQEAARLTADQKRDDLVSAGVGDGAHAFVYVLPPQAMRPGAKAEVTLLDVATRQRIGAPVGVRWHAAAPNAEPPPMLSGSLDRVSRDGWVSGWCWFPEKPDLHAELTVLIDAVPVGHLIADTFRADLHQAGIGDGRHGFSFALPYASLAEQGTLTVTVQERRSGRTLGEPITMRLGRMAAAEERIQELERQVRLLQGQITAQQTADAAAAEERSARALFATVAAFFRDLAEGGVPGAAAGLSLPQALQAAAGRLPHFALAVPARPVATICIAATAPLDALHACLAAIHAAGLDRAADVVVVDDAASGAQAALLPALVDNLRYHFAADGDGLVAARDQIAAEARGEFVLFLAPEAHPQPGFLDEIVQTFTRTPQAVMVGGRLLREDGLLQHAGLFARSAMALDDLGHLAPDDAPEFGYQRPVDALAGYAVAIRAAALQEAGGFGPLYARFGHAVADLCARLRAAGQTILYQPVATALWRAQAPIADGAPPDLAMPDEETLRLRERLADGWPDPVRFIGRALVIDDDMPQPDRDAGSVLTFEQILILCRLGYHVTFAPVHGAEPDAAAVAALARHGIALAAPPQVASVTEFLKRDGARLDLVHIYRHANAAMLEERIRQLAPAAKLVFAPADLHYLRESRRAELTGQAAPDDLRDAELRCVRAADVTIVHSGHELALLARETDPSRLVLLRWIARPTPPTRGFAARRDICFVGNYRHLPNLDGVQWFAAEVMPRLRERLPQVRLLLAGSFMPDAIRALACDAIEILGWVPDLAELFGSVRLSVAPLRYGAGFKGKVATSLAHGLPVVGSSISLEGTGLSDGDGVAVADDPADFAAAVVRLYEDAGLWAAQSARALERVEALYAPAAAEAVWRDMLTRLGLPAAP